MNRAWMGSGVLVCAALGCGDVTVATTTSSASSSTGEEASSATASSSGSSGSGGAGGQGGSASATTGTGGGCGTIAGQDLDQDGFSPGTGDCDDCNPMINPAAVEVLANGWDDDCNGSIDEAAPTCDLSLDVADNDPFHAARAVDLCKLSLPMGPQDWGVVSAKWVAPDGTAPSPTPDYAIGHGILTDLGPNVHVQSGKSFLALSSGTARRPTDPDYKSVSGFNKGYTDGYPAGFPKASPACPGIVTGTPHDGVGLEVAVRVPSNALGFSFDFNYFTFEYPAFKCTQYNDVFLALVSPIPVGLPDGNISFDPQGNLISSGTNFIEVCSCQPCQAGACTLGNSGLVGTGYQVQGDHGSTGWLASTAPATPGQVVTIRWTNYDSGDGYLDNTTLIDHWKWITTPGTQVATTRILNPL